jgi:hypothetical protein
MSAVSAWVEWPWVLNALMKDSWSGDENDGDELVQAGEVAWVSSEQRQSLGKCGGGDQWPSRRAVERRSAT